VGVVSATLETHRYFLTLLIWSLMLEIIVIAYYAGKGDFGFYLQLTVIMMLITVLGIWAIISKIRKEVREGSL
jgi:hypothetical protein